MKPLIQTEFDNLLERRVNLIARTLQDIATTTDNNPSLMDETRFEKMQQFIGAHLTHTIEVVNGAMNRPQPVALGTFTLGDPKAKKPRAKKTEGTAPAPTVTTVEVQPGAGDPVVMAREEPAPAPVATTENDDDGLGELAALLDEAA